MILMIPEQVRVASGIDRPVTLDRTRTLIVAALLCMGIPLLLWVLTIPPGSSIEQCALTIRSAVDTGSPGAREVWDTPQCAGLSDEDAASAYWRALQLERRST